MSKWERIPVYAGLLLLSVLCVWALKPQTEFERVTVVNEHGDRAVELSATPRGTGLILILNREDNTALSLSEAGMKCYGDEGKEHVWIGRRNTDKTPGSITLSDSSGINQVVLSGCANGGRVCTYTPGGKMLTFMGGFAVPGGESFERPLAGAVQSYDFKGGSLAAFGTNSKGGGSLTLWGSDGQVMFDVPSTLKGRSEEGRGRSRVE